LIPKSARKPFKKFDAVGERGGVGGEGGRCVGIWGAFLNRIGKVFMSDS